MYVLASVSGRTYVGCTVDLERRLDEHNGKRRGGAKSTRVGRPWQIAKCYGPYPDRSTAQRVEAKVKSLSGTKRLTWSEDDSA